MPQPNPLDPFDAESAYIALHLLDLPPTQALNAAIARVDDDLDLLGDTGDPSHRTRLLGLKRDALSKLADAAIRDALAAARPDGCWCLGLGGRDATGCLLPDVPGVWRITCPACPEGLAAAERLERARAFDQVHRLPTRLAQLLGQSGVPDRYRLATFDSYPVTEHTAPALAAIRAWEQAIIDRHVRHWSLWLWGNFGSGKTSLACALLARWRQRTNHVGQFVTSVDLLEAIRSSRDAGISSHWLIQNVQEFPFIVLDDLGAELDTRWVAEKLFAIINARHNDNRITIFTSNTGPRDLFKQLAGEGGDAVMAERIVWRMSEMCEIVPLSGPNLREPHVRTSLGLAPEENTP